MSSCELGAARGRPHMEHGRQEWTALLYKATATQYINSYWAQNEIEKETFKFVSHVSGWHTSEERLTDCEEGTRLGVRDEKLHGHIVESIWKYIPLVNGCNLVDDSTSAFKQIL